MRKYSLIARIDFTDKYDESKKYIKGEEISVDEERALELLSSSTPVVRFISRDEDDNSKFDELNNQVKTLTETIEKLTQKNGELEAEKVKLSEAMEALITEKDSLGNQVQTSTDKIENLTKKDNTKKDKE